MDRLRALLWDLVPSSGVARLHARGMLALRFAIVGWRVAKARERLAERRALATRRARS